MNEVVTAYPHGEFHVFVDNLNAHKPKQGCWLRPHPRAHPHFTATQASWLNQLEVRASPLARKALHEASFTSACQLREPAGAFITAYNPRAVPPE